MKKIIWLVILIIIAIIIVKWVGKGTLPTPSNPSGTTFEDTVTGDQYSDATASENGSVTTTTSSSNNVDGILKDIESSMESDASSDASASSAFSS